MIYNFFDYRHVGNKTVALALTSEKQVPQVTIHLRACRFHKTNSCQ